MHTRARAMMYRVGAPGLQDDASVPELLDTFVMGFEQQLTTQISRLARDTRQTFVAEPIRLLFRGPARARIWQRAWKVVSTHEVVLRVTVDMAESEPNVVRGCVNASIVAETDLGQLVPQSSAHLSARSVYFRERLLAGAHAVVEGQRVVATRRADLTGHPAAQLLRDDIEVARRPE